MELLSDRVRAMIIVATISSVASSAHATPLSAGSLALRGAASPAVETVQWRGWGWGWGWGGFGALAAAPYYSGYYDPYYYSSYYYPPTYYGYYAPSYGYYAPTYYGGYGYSDYGYSPYYGYGWSYPGVWLGLGHRSNSTRHR